MLLDCGGVIPKRKTGKTLISKSYSKDTQEPKSPVYFVNISAGNGCWSAEQNVQFVMKFRTLTDLDLADEIVAIRSAEEFNHMKLFLAYNLA